MDNTAIKRSQSKRHRRIKEKYCRVRTERLDSLGLPSPVQSSPVIAVSISFSLKKKNLALLHPETQQELKLVCTLLYSLSGNEVKQCCWPRRVVWSYSV